MAATSFKVSLEPTELYFRYRQEAVPNAQPPSAVKLMLRLGAHGSTYTERSAERAAADADFEADEAVAELRPISAGADGPRTPSRRMSMGAGRRTSGTASRRHSRIQAAREGDVPAVGDPEDNPLELTEFLCGNFDLVLL